MLIGVIADDFTGASDIANTLAKGAGPQGGLHTAQFPGVPETPAPKDIEAGVVSLKSRTVPVAEAVSQSLAALNWLKAQGCQQFIFKYCSTFDSTKDGNIGPVAEALADALDAQSVIFCPAFPTTGRTLYQGHLFVNGQLLNESGMQNHPLTPMTDADIRRWLGHQTSVDVGHVPVETVHKGADAVRALMADAPARFLVADAISDADLMTLGVALKGAKLITGGSGIALGLPANFIDANRSDLGRQRYSGVQGAEAILAGSCSGATRGQVEHHAQSHPTLAIDVPGVMAGTVTKDTLVSFYQEHAGNAPLAFSSGTPEDVRAIQSKFGRDVVAAKLDALFADTAEALIDAGYRRLVVAGGETSGAVAQAVAHALGAPAMTIGPEIDPGVPVLRVGTDDPVALALKSGNFGARDFFAKALQMMEADQ